MNTCIHITESTHHALHLKLRQHFKSTTLQKQMRRPPWNGITLLSWEQRNLERLIASSVGEDVKKREPLSTSCDNVKWYLSRRYFWSYIYLEIIYIWTFLWVVNFQRCECINLLQFSTIELILLVGYLW